MADVRFKVTVKDNQQVKFYLKRRRKKALNLVIPLKKAGLLMLRSINRNFESSGRPNKWKPLKRSTLLAKVRKGFSPKPLIRSGAMKRSITFTSNRKRLAIGTSIVYGAIHQFGGRAGRHLSAKIPKRTYLLFQNQDLEDIEELITDHLLGD